MNVGWNYAGGEKEGELKGSDDTLGGMVLLGGTRSAGGSWRQMRLKPGDIALLGKSSPPLSFCKVGMNRARGEKVGEL